MTDELREFDFLGVRIVESDRVPVGEVWVAKGEKWKPSIGTLATCQQSLGGQFSKVLNENLDDLYESWGEDNKPNTRHPSKREEVLREALEEIYSWLCDVPEPEVKSGYPLCAYESMKIAKQALKGE